VTIADGRMNTDDLALSTPDYGIHGAGWADFEQRVDLDCKLIASQALTADIIAEVREVRYLTRDSDRLEIPFRLRGQLPGARVEPDAKKIAKALRQAVLEKGLGAIVGNKQGGDDRERGQIEPAEDLLQKGFRKLFGKKRDR
jgi:hypothetical protein